MRTHNDTIKAAMMGETNAGMAAAAALPASPWQMASTLDALAERYKPESHEHRTISAAAELLRDLNSSRHDAIERAELAEDRCGQLRDKMRLALLALQSVSPE